MEIITLSNGKRVANFSSPHSFTFTDGSVLPAVSDEESERLKVIFHEENFNDGDIELSFCLSKDVEKEMMNWKTKKIHKEVDVVFCPLPMITAIRLHKGWHWLKASPFRAIRIENRVKKLVSIEKQCI